MNCLRCGKQMEGQETFCRDCRETVQVPLEDSPYLNTQVILPSARKPLKPQPAKSGKRLEKKASRTESRGSSKGLSVFLAVLCIVMTVAMLGAALFYLDARAERDRLRAEVSSLQEKNRTQKTQLDFLSDSFVLAQTGEEKVFHRTDCPMVDRNTCVILRLQMAQSLNYTPCPYCH